MLRQAKCLKRNLNSMTIQFIALIVIALSLLAILVVVLKKIPQLRVIDVNTLAKERSRQVKEKLIMQKFKRKGGKRLKTVSKLSSGAVKTASKYGRRAVQRLYALEQYYQRLKKSASEGQHAYDKETIKKFISQAESLVKEGEYIPAEKIYIDIISHNPKSIEAYEGLGNLYMANESFDQARETLQFSLKLSPNDASVLVSLAELEMKLENDREALEYLCKAVGKRGKNPKYLDYYIQTSLKVGSLKDARKGISQLRDVNPDNKKISEFEDRFQDLKAKYVEKTSGGAKGSSQKG